MQGINDGFMSSAAQKLMKVGSVALVRSTATSVLAQKAVSLGES